jgi:hypothetical protein
MVCLSHAILRLIPILNQSATFVGTACPGAGRGCRLPQRMYKYASSPPPSRLNITFDLEMVLLVHIDVILFHNLFVDWKVATRFLPDLLA